MSSLPLDQWQAALDRIDASLSAATKALDRAEERFEMTFAPSAGEGEPPARLSRLDARLAEWEARVAAAEELVAAGEQELVGRLVAVERWRALFARWEELVQR
jgi:uncharacterized coiled-coil protein SlyX